MASHHEIAQKAMELEKKARSSVNAFSRNGKKNPDTLKEAIEVEKKVANFWERAADRANREPDNINVRRTVGNYESSMRSSQETIESWQEQYDELIDAKNYSSKTYRGLAIFALVSFVLALGASSFGITGFVIDESTTSTVSYLALAFFGLGIILGMAYVRKISKLRAKIEKKSGKKPLKKKK